MKLDLTPFLLAAAFLGALLWLLASCRSDDAFLKQLLSALAGAAIGMTFITAFLVIAFVTSRSLK
jgi:hypothetical protein